MAKLLSFPCQFASKTTFQCQLDHVFGGNLLVDYFIIFFFLNLIHSKERGKLLKSLDGRSGKYRTYMGLYTGFVIH